MYLVANGHSREFYYERPRSGMREVGVQPDTLLFFGVAVGAQYEGTAYIFSRKCGALPYHVAGPILDNYRRVVMYGQAPRVDGACRVVGYQNDVLEFNLID